MNKLSLSKTDKKLGGVCGGLGESFGVDSTLIRLGFILGVIFLGTGIFLYLVLWILLHVLESNNNN